MLRNFVSSSNAYGLLSAGLLAFKLVQLHGPNGQLIEINRDEVVSLRQPRGDEKHFHSDVRCLVFTSDGKFTGVQESCTEVQDKLGTNGNHHP